MGFKLQAVPLRVMIHDHLQRVIRGEMLEQTKKDGVTVSRVDIRHVDHAFIAARLGHGLTPAMARYGAAQAEGAAPSIRAQDTKR